MSTAIQVQPERTANEDYIEFLRDTFPAQGDWSESKYMWFTDLTNRLVELTDGVLEFLPMPTELHQNIVGLFYVLWLQVLEPLGGKVVFSPLRMKVRDNKVREPDVLVLLNANDERRDNRMWYGADIVMEVISPDDPDRDLVKKRSDYAEAKIPEYWIVDPRTEEILILQLQGDAYAEAAKLRRGDTATSLILPAFSVRVDEVFNVK